MSMRKIIGFDKDRSENKFSLILADMCKDSLSTWLSDNRGRISKILQDLVTGIKSYSRIRISHQPKIFRRYKPRIFRSYQPRIFRSY